MMEASARPQMHYSLTTPIPPSRVETRLRPSTAPSTTDNANDFVYKTDHMIINLGPRAWTRRAPAYGQYGVIQGSIKFLGQQQHVDKVTVTLEGIITASTTEGGMLASQLKLPMISQMSTLYSASEPFEFHWHGERAFSLPIPIQSQTKRGPVTLPPTYYGILPGTTGEVAYSLRFDMTRKGMRRHESKTVSLLYLPKTRPSQAPMTRIPPPPSRERSIPYSSDPRFKTMDLSVMFSKTLDTKSYLFLSLPSPACFPSGEDIPFVLNFFSRKAPQTAELVASNLRVELIKRIRMWRNEAHEYSFRNTVLGVADVSRGQPFNGFSVLKGAVRAGQSGREASWQVYGIIDIQYHLRILHNSVDSAKPVVIHEELVQITTDHWGSLERELVSSGGIPTPAMGLLP